MVAPGYPEEVIVECIEPENYPDVWYYKVWLQGRWKNFDNIAKCIDPHRCYDPPPALPEDFSVQNNQTTDKPNTSNTTLLYSCVRQCKFIGSLI